METIDNRILEHLRAFRTDIGSIKDDIRELKLRIGNLEVGQATMMQHLGHHASVSAQQHLSYDRIIERLEKLGCRVRSPISHALRLTLPAHHQNQSRDGKDLTGM